MLSLAILQIQIVVSATLPWVLYAMLNQRIIRHPNAEVNRPQAEPSLSPTLMFTAFFLQSRTAEE